MCRATACKACCIAVIFGNYMRQKNRLADMDDIVKQALEKWPNVPDCWGWLGLDMRGNWWLRDSDAQALGAFPASKGTLLAHEKLLSFIGRNYEADQQGQWFFQNGPQRVFVELESTPMIWRVHADGRVVSHTGLVAQQVQQCLLDEHGHVYLLSEGVLGLVHSLDMLHAAAAIESGQWQVEDVQAHTLAARFGFVRSPQQRQLGQA